MPYVRGVLVERVREDRGRLQELEANRIQGLPFDDVAQPLQMADARIAGHRTLNGKWMNVGQAADAFVRRVLGGQLAARGLPGEIGYDRVFEIMVRVW